MDIKKIQRTTFISTLWTFLYFLWFRWFMLHNWQFNIFSSNDWKSTFNDWWYHGWIIQGSYFWIFVISIFLFIPVWIWGLCFFLSIDYKKHYEKLFWDVIYKKKTKQVQANNKQIRVKKKKSYRQVRPKALSGTPQMVAPVQPQQPVDMMTSAPSTASMGMGAPNLMMEEKLPDSLASSSFSHREIADDFNGASPFASAGMENNYGMPMNLGAMDTPVELKEDLPAIMQAAGATVIANPVLGENKISFLAVSKDQVFLILTDAEKGDWLADEERFNDEDPLWFSETSHRVSPITQLKNFEKALNDKMFENGLKSNTHIILVKTDGNIINAEDMADVWRQMGALVARSATGMPEELPSFTETFPKELQAADMEQVDKIKQIVNG